MHQQLEFDAIIVGSGFGGAVVTCRLAQAGFKVLLIERGRRYEGADFPALPREGQLLPDLRRWLWTQDQGLWDVEDLEELVSVQAAGYGGGSLIYANVHLRPPAAVFDSSWPEKFRGRSTLDPFFDLAAYMLDASPADAHSGFPFPKSETLRRTAEELGRKDGCFTPLLAVNTVRGRNRHGEFQNGCTACGKCCSGCPERAKNTLDMNYLAVAEQNGAEVLTQCEVKRIRQTDSGWGVQYFDHLQAEWRSVGAKSLFVCAGALHSTRLLASARLKVRSREIKQRVGLGYFPNADALAMIYDARQETLPSHGPAITTAILHTEDDGRFFMIQDGGFAEELERLFGMLRAPLWLGRNRVRAATVPRPQEPQEGTESTPAPSLDGVLPSPLDGLLSAVSGGALEGLLHRDLRAIWPEFIEQFQKPLLLPRVVDSTIERTLVANHRASFLGRHLGAENVLFKIWRRVTHRFTQLLLARSDVIGAHAFQALLSGADSPREDFLREVLGFERSGARNRLLLLAMGSDAAPGVLLHDRRSGRMIADLDFYYLAPGYSAQERLMHDIARNLGGELRLNPAWSFLGKPITVHGQGGCRMSDNPALGVTDWSGEVHGCPGLYVVDGSVFCRSVGVNPSATILAIAEHNALTYIRRAKQSPGWPANDLSPGARQYQRHRDGAELWRDRARRENWAVEPPSTARVEFESSPLGVKFDETMRGYVAPLSSSQDPRHRDAEYRALETKGRPKHTLELKLSVSAVDLQVFLEDFKHQLDVSGTLTLDLPGFPSGKPLPVRGSLLLLVPRHKPYGLESEKARSLQTAIARTYNTRPGSPPPGRARFMRYYLSIGDDDFRLEGYKRIRQDPGLDAWRDTSSLFVKLGVPRVDSDGKKLSFEHRDSLDLRAAGVVHVDVLGFLYEQLPSIQVTGTRDPARAGWAVSTFASFFFGSLQRIYAPELLSALDAVFRRNPSNVRVDEVHRRR